MGKSSKTIAKGKGRKAMPPITRKPATKQAIQQVAAKVVKAEEKKGYAPGLLGGIGNAVGSFFGGSAGGTVGSSVGNWLGKITGMGAYKITSNSLIGGSVPTFGNGAGTTLCHREFIGDVSGSVAFTNTSYAVNPGQSGLFPWLSLCSAQFEEYDLLGMIVEFKSTSAVALNSTNTALGTVILATDYDSYDTVFANKQQMEAYQYSTSAPPSQSQLHPIECAPKQNVLRTKYIRSGLVAPSGADLRFYDVGNFQLATVGMQAAAVIGELWVTYHVKFTKPKLPTPVGAGLVGARFSKVNVSTQTSWVGAVAAPGSNFGLTFGASTLTGIPPGRFIAVFEVEAPTSLSVYWSPVASTNCTLVSGTTANGSGVMSATDGANRGLSVLVFDCTGNGVLTSLGLVVTNGCTLTCSIQQISSGLTAEKLTLEQRLAEIEEKFSLMSTPAPTQCSTPIHVEREDDLERSVYVPRETVRALLGVR